MDLHRSPHTQDALETAEVIIGDVLLDHLGQLLPAGKPPAIVTLPLEDAPKALHRPIVNALSHLGHALCNASRSQLVMEDLGSIGAAPVAVEQRVGAGIGLQCLIQSAMDQGSVVGVPDDKGDDPSVTQIQDGAQVELAHGISRIVVKLRHIGEPLFVGAVGVKLAVQYILCQLPGRGCHPSAAMWGMFYRRLNPKAAADAQRPLIVDWRMVILVQIVPNAAVALVRALMVDLLHQLGDALVLSDAPPGFPGAPLVIAGPGDMQCTAGWPHRKSLFFRTAAHRFILLFLPELPQRSTLSSSCTFFRRYSSIFSNSFSFFSRAFSIRRASSRLRGVWSARRLPLRSSSPAEPSS